MDACMCFGCNMRAVCACVLHQSVRHMDQRWHLTADAAPRLAPQFHLRVACRLLGLLPSCCCHRRAQQISNVLVSGCAACVDVATAG